MPLHRSAGVVSVHSGLNDPADCVSTVRHVGAVEPGAHPLVEHTTRPRQGVLQLGDRGAERPGDVEASPLGGRRGAPRLVRPGRTPAPTAAGAGRALAGRPRPSRAAPRRWRRRRRPAAPRYGGGRPGGPARRGLRPRRRGHDGRDHHRRRSLRRDRPGRAHGVRRRDRRGARPGSEGPSCPGAGRSCDRHETVHHLPSRGESPRGRQPSTRRLPHPSTARAARARRQEARRRGSDRISRGPTSVERRTGGVAGRFTRPGEGEEQRRLGEGHPAEIEGVDRLLEDSHRVAEGTRGDQRPGLDNGDPGAHGGDVQGPGAARRAGRRPPSPRRDRRGRARRRPARQAARPP